MLFFELLQIAIGNRKMLSHTPTAEEWRELYTLAKKQAMVGIAFRGVEQLPKEQRPPKQLLMLWYMVTERIKAMNTDLDRKALAVANKFLEEGFPGVVLKGQGIAQLYRVEQIENSKLKIDNGLPEGDAREYENDNENQGTGKISILNSQFSIKEYRTPGDIDIWLHGERDEILEYVRRHIPDCKPVYHHVDFPVLDDVYIEVHFTPTWMNSPVRNRCLQRFFKSMVNSLFNQRDKHTNLDASTHTQACAGHPDEGFGLTQKAQKAQNLHDASPVPSGVIACSDHETKFAGRREKQLHGLHEYSGASETKIISHGCSRIDTDSRIASLACGHPDGTVDRRPLTVDTCLDSKQATLPVPNAAFNRIYILVHIYRHLFAEGVGLRQLLDYYFVLQQGFTEVEREETLRTLRSLGMMRFTRAVMWVLQEVYGMPDRYLLTSPDEEEGEFLLDEIMLAGNFGKYDERMQRAEGEGTFRWGLRKVIRNFRFVRSYPSEVLWSPLFKVWHLFWRIRR